MPIIHYAFSDDSRHMDERYNSLATITLKNESFNQLNNQLIESLKSSGIDDEFKWEKLRNAKYRFAANKIIDFVFQNQNSIRLDIVIWDLEDNRHKYVKGRDDSENLVRMYYHLISSTLSMRWPILDSLWKWYPDEQSSVDWKTLQDCISNKKHVCVADLFQRNPDFERVNLKTIKPSKSSDFPFIQVSDLFAGMAAYSFGHFDKFKKWQDQINSQLSLFHQEKQKFSNSEKERFTIIKKFNEMVKSQKLQVAFDSTKGFKSYKPENFINFWFYEPQHKKDKAPATFERNNIQ